MKRSLILGIVATVTAQSLADPALAEPPRGKKAQPATTDPAKQFVDTGIEYFNKGNLKAARASFVAARDLAPEKPAPWYFLARTEAQMGDCDAARRDLEALQLKAKQGDSRPSEVAEAIKSCEARRGPVAASAPASSSAPVVVVPKPEQPAQPTVAVPHRLDAPPPSAPTTPSPPVAAVVQPAPLPQGLPTEVRPPVLPTPPLPEPTAPHRGLLWGGVALLAAGVAVGVGGGVGFGLAADGKAAAIKNEQDQGVRFDPALDDARQLYQKLAYASWAVGGALALTGSVLAITGTRRATAEHAPQVRVTPLLSIERTGILLTGVF